MDGLREQGSVEPASVADRRRWSALTMVCLAVLMIVLDTTVVNVALPSIRNDLRFSETELVWVVNSYLLSFAGTLLLGGRLGDLYGRRKLFLIGVAVFTLASLACGLAYTPAMLITSRAIQGIGGAVSVAVALSLIVTMFPRSRERAKAMSLYGFLSAAGGSIGLLVGGILTSAVTWHWIFFINLPVGVAVYSLCYVLLPRGCSNAGIRGVDFWGAITVTCALMLLVFTIINGNHLGWGTFRTIGLLGCALALLCIFWMIEANAPAPLVPLRIFAAQNFTISNVVRMLWAAGGYSWFFVTTLYLQLVSGYNPMQVGLAFLPSNLITAIFAAGFLARIVARFGVKRPLVVGLLMVAAGFAMFVRAPIDAEALIDVVPGMILVGLGTGVAFSPLLLAAMKDTAPAESGLASGIVNTAAMLGGTLGLAAIASLSSAHGDALLTSGVSLPVSLAGGYRMGFMLAAGCVCAAALIGALFLRVDCGTPHRAS